MSDSCGTDCRCAVSFGVEEKRFPMPVILRAAGLSRLSFAHMRNVKSFLSDTAGPRGKDRYFSVLDTALTISVVSLTRQGLGLSDALWIAETFLRSVFTTFLAGKRDWSLVGFHSGGLRFSVLE